MAFHIVANYFASYTVLTGREKAGNLYSMSQYVIRGKRGLSGSIEASGNKNAALPCIAAAILSDEPVVLRNVPQIEDVHILLDILRDLGGKDQRGRGCR